MVIRTPVTPRKGALLEGAPLPYNSEAYERFAARYLDEHGYLKYVPRWGTIDDGPDDATETFGSRTLLHALGDSDSVPALHKRAYEGRLRRYGELRTRPTELAARGACHNAFITRSDWSHTGQGMCAFMLQGLSDPNDSL